MNGYAAILESKIPARQAAKLLGKSYAGVLQLIHERKLEAIYVGRWVTSQKWIDEYVERETARKLAEKSQ